MLEVVLVHHLDGRVGRASRVAEQGDLDAAVDQGTAATSRQPRQGDSIIGSTPVRLGSAGPLVHATGDSFAPVQCRGEVDTGVDER